MKAEVGKVKREKWKEKENIEHRILNNEGPEKFSHKATKTRRKTKIEKGQGAKGSRGRG